MFPRLLRHNNAETMTCGILIKFEANGDIGGPGISRLRERNLPNVDVVEGGVVIYNYFGSYYGCQCWRSAVPGC